MTRRKREGVKSLTMVGEISALLLVSVFAVMSLLLVGIGTRGYTSVSEDAIKVSRARDSLSYVSGKLRALDGEAKIDVRPFEGGDALVFSFAIEGENYETRIFRHDGWLCEQFSSASTPMNGELAERIVEIAGFTAQKDELWLFTVTDIDGTVYTQYAAERSKEASAI